MACGARSNVRRRHCLGAAGAVTFDIHNRGQIVGVVRSPTQRQARNPPAGRPSRPDAQDP
jgi:hypothetical protein